MRGAPRVAAVPVRDCGEPLVRLDPGFGPTRALVRAGLGQRLEAARRYLPGGIGLRVAEGYRPPERQQAIIDDYRAQLLAAEPGLGAARLDELASRFVAPMQVAPHTAAAAVDLTLTGPDGAELDMGTVIDATPEQSAGACFFDAPGIGAAARGHRQLLAAVLRQAGLVNYPTEWWHWSYGDRYWALVTGAPAAWYGPVLVPAAA